MKAKPSKAKAANDGKVTAYKAADGTLFEHKVDRDIHDKETALDAELAELATSIEERFPYVDDWRAKAISGVDETALMLRNLLAMNSTSLKHAMKRHEELIALRQKKAQRRLDAKTAVKNTSSESKETAAKSKKKKISKQKKVRNTSAKSE